MSFKGFKHSKEAIEKIRISKIGNIPWNKGINISPITIKKN